MRAVVRWGILDPASITKKIVRNENYGGDDAGVYGWRAVDIEPMRRKPLFFEQLEISIAAEGVRNPILVYQTSSGLFLSFGGSRLRVAQKLGYGIPCIINDFTPIHKAKPEVTPANWQSFFTDVPRGGEFLDDGTFDYHYALERNRRHEWDAKGLCWIRSKGVSSELDATFLSKEFPWLTEGDG